MVHYFTGLYFEDMIEYTIFNGTFTGLYLEEIIGSTKFYGTFTGLYLEDMIKSTIFNVTLTGLYLESKKEGKDQESIQSSTIPDPEYQWESDNVTNTHHKREPRGRPFPAGDHKASTEKRA